jgi:hypothetical protein
MTIFDIKEFIEILGNAGQFFFGLVALIISVYAIFTKGKDVFKSELAKSQFTEMGNIRNQLSELFFDIYYVKDIKLDLERMSWRLEEFKLLCPEEWSQFQRYKNNSYSLFYKFMTPDYYLLPKWIDRALVKEYFETMQTFAPFTVLATGSKNIQEVEIYQTKMQELIKHIDISLKRNS